MDGSCRRGSMMPRRGRRGGDVRDKQAAMDALVHDGKVNKRQMRGRLAREALRAEALHVRDRHALL